MIRDIVNVLSIFWARNTARKLVGNILNVLMIYSWVFPRYIVHVLAMYLQCPGSGNWGLPPVIAKQKRCSAAIENAFPRLKRRRLEIPACTRLQGWKNNLFFARADALMKIERMLNVKKSPFHGGHNGQQARRAHAIHSYLHMLARNNRRRIDALERAAEAQGFAAGWGVGMFGHGQRLGLTEVNSLSHKGEDTSRFSHSLRIPKSTQNCIHMFIQTNGQLIQQNLLISPLKRWFQLLQRNMGRT